MKPTIIFVVGPTGVGKSAVGKMIAKNLQYTYIDKDVATSHLSEYILEVMSPANNKHDRESTFYTQTVRPLEYNSILTQALDNLELGNNVVMTAGFELEMQDAHWLDTHPIMQKIITLAQLKVVHVHVDKQTLLKRLISRNELRDAWKLNNWDVYCQQVDHMKITWDIMKYELLKFDNSDALPILYDLKVENLMSQLKKAQ